MDSQNLQCSFLQPYPYPGAYKKMYKKRGYLLIYLKYTKEKHKFLHIYIFNLFSKLLMVSLVLQYPPSNKVCSFYIYGFKLKESMKQGYCVV